MSAGDSQEQFVPSLTTVARYCQLMLAPPDTHGYYRAYINEALEAQRDGERNAYFDVVAIDRQTYVDLTGVEPPPHARRLLAACTLDGDHIPYVRVVTVAELMNEPAAQAHHAEAVSLIKSLDDELGDFVAPLQASSKRTEDRLKRERDGRVLDVQLAVKRLLSIPPDVTPISEDAALKVTEMLVPKSGSGVSA